MLATCLHMMQGTPYIYQGEELGMTNAPFGCLEDYRDLESFNAYHDLVGRGVYSKEEMMRCLSCKSRDNARTPMQWDDSVNAGFTEGNPWIMVNPNYKTINAKDQLRREDSVFHYYRKLVKLRHEMPVIVYGKYKVYQEDHEDVYAYTRTLCQEKKTDTLFVVCNFTNKKILFEIPREFKQGNLVINNYSDAIAGSSILRPYEAKVIHSCNV